MVTGAKLSNVDPRPARLNRRHARHVIHVAMRDEHERERTATERSRDVVDVLRIADTSVDHRRDAARQQIRVGASRTRQSEGFPRGSESPGIVTQKCS
jgi:hypothetical protein